MVCSVRAQETLLNTSQENPTTHVKDQQGGKDRTGDDNRTLHAGSEDSGNEDMSSPTAHSCLSDHPGSNSRDSLKNVEIEKSW